MKRWTFGAWALAGLAAAFLVPTQAAAQWRVTETETWVSVSMPGCAVFFTPQGRFMSKGGGCTDRQVEEAEDEYDRWARNQRSPTSSRTYTTNSSSTSSREDADWFVTEGARNNLEVMNEPSMRGRIVVDGIRDGTRVRNLGCERHENDTWCRIEVGRELGWARIRYLQPDDRGSSSSSGHALSDLSRERAGATEFFQVDVRGTLRLKSAPSVDAGNVMNLENGDVVRNLGCERHGGESWCRVEVDREVGWIRERYLRPY